MINLGLKHKPAVRNRQNGFTLAEVLITVIIIAILSSIVGVSMYGTQAKTRDSQRNSSVTIISGALEKFYQANGSYPTCEDLSKDPDAVTNTILKGLPADSLTAPGASKGTNSISCTVPTINSYFYNSSTTEDGRGIAGRQYTIKYIKEITGDVEVVKGRYGIALLDSSSINASAASDTEINLTWSVVDKATDYRIQRATDNQFKNDLYEETIKDLYTTQGGLITGTKYYFRVIGQSMNASSDWSDITYATTTVLPPSSAAPIVAVNTAGLTSTWSWNSATCASGTVAKYKYTYTRDDGFNSGLQTPTDEHATSIQFTTANEGYTYTVAVQAQCSTAIAESTLSAAGSASYLRPMTSPVSSIIAVTYSSPNVVATVSPTTCGTGTTTQYSIRSRTNDGTWGSYSAWSDTIRTASQTASQGVKYGYQARIRCHNVVNDSNLTTSIEDTYVHPINTPASPVVSANTIGSTTTWSWPAVTCAAGTSTKYQYRYTINNGYDSDLVETSATSVAFSTPNEGYTFTVAVQTQCYTSITSSALSNPPGQASYTRPMTAPIAPSIAVTYSNPNVIATISPTTCASGTTAQYAIRSRTNDGTWGSYSAWSTTLTASQAASQGVKYGYQAQARCYNAVNTSGVSTGTEGTYTHPINTPASPVVSANTVGSTTTWSWPAVTCAAGSVSYQYLYTNDGGYSSGWTANASTSVAFTTSNPGYTFTVQVQTHCSTVATSSAWSTPPGQASYRRPFTYTLTTIAGTGGSVSAGGSYLENTSATITATANTGYSFSGWSGTGCSGTASHSITMTSNMSCTANFTVNYYTVSVASGGNGSVSGGGSIAYNSSTTITATPNTGYSFSSWSGTGCSGTASHSITVTSAMSCTANFTINYYTVTVGAGTGGTVSGGGSVAYNSSTTITATPSSGYVFSSWSGTGCSGTASHSITVTSAMSCTANFTVSNYTITLLTSGRGNYTNCASENGTCSFTGTSNVRYGAYSNWNYKYNVAGSTACTNANFGDPLPNYTKTCQYQAAVSVTGAGTYSAGTSRTITASPSGSFDSWTGGTGCSGTYSHSFTLNADTTCTANFSNHLVDSPTPPPAPSAPSLSASFVSNNAVLTVNAVSCSVGSAEYQIRYLRQKYTSDASWTSWTSWSTTRSMTQVAQQGNKHNFEVVARCNSGGTYSLNSPTASTNITMEISTPAAPTYTGPASFSHNVYQVVNFTSYCPSNTDLVNGTFVSNLSSTANIWGPHPFGFNDHWTNLEGRTLTATYWGTYQCQTSFKASPVSPQGVKQVPVYSG